MTQYIKNGYEKSFTTGTVFVDFLRKILRITECCQLKSAEV